MQSKLNLITKRNEILQLAPQEIEGLIIDSLGLKVEVIKKRKQHFYFITKLSKLF